MDKTPTTVATEDRARRVIKRYSNRKLYDTRDSRYVTLLQIAEMVRAGEDVQIIDNATKEDKTEVTLALIISEELKTQPRAVPLAQLREMIYQRSEKILSQLREGPIGRLIPVTDGKERDGEVAADGTVVEGAVAADATAAAEAPTAPTTPAATPTQKDGKASILSDLVETSKHRIDEWQHAVDERVRAVLPSFAGFQNLQTELKKLTSRVEELEGRLRGKQDDKRKE